MSTTSVVAAPAADASTGAIARPGENCWRVSRADRFFCVQDAAHYFELVRQALLDARETVFMLGWDIFAAIDLLPDASAVDAPTRLDELLTFIAARRPHLRIYILIWDHAALYSLERDPLTRWRLGWRMPRQVHFGFDDDCPIGGSHHQKVVVVDDQLAFSGGIDLTGHRWDTSAHRVEEASRVNATGEPYGPYHEIQAMVSGAVAADLGALARDRWRALGERRLPAAGRPSGDLWPSDVVPDLTDVNVAIARTLPAVETRPGVRECEALFLDSIAAARESIYIESQYLTNDRLAAALAARLGEPTGPEVLIVTPKECHGWLEQNTMGAFRAEVFRQLLEADRHQRLRIVYPLASRQHDVATFVHSKVMVVDDCFLRIGSANFSRRSMGVDTECDLAVEASDATQRAAIQRTRDRLVGEHLGLSPDAATEAIARAGSLLAVVDAHASAERTLALVEPPGEIAPPSPALRAAADPDEPMELALISGMGLPRLDPDTRRHALRFWIPGIALTVLSLTVLSLTAGQPLMSSLRAALIAVPATSSISWLAVAAFVVANAVLIPWAGVTLAAAVLLGGVQGGLVAWLGSSILAIGGFALGRVLGASAVTRWVSRRAYRTVRQLGSHGVAGVILLRVTASVGALAVHLLCGAARVPFASYALGSIAGVLPGIVALGALGELMRRALLAPSLANGLLVGAAGLLIAGGVALLRAGLLARRFAPAIARQRGHAEFG